MAAKRYNLNINEFDTIVNEYLTSLGERYSFFKQTTDNQIIYRIKEGKKEISILTCYISVGRTSFSFGGINQEIAKECSFQLIRQAEIKIDESRTFTVKTADEDEVRTILDFLIEDCSSTIEDIPISLKKNQGVKRFIKITGNYGEVITLTHYSTNTLLVQGRPSMLFLSFIDISTELFNPTEIKKEHLKSFDVSVGANIIESNLKAHLPNAYPKIGTKLDAIMAPALILLNTPLELSDYTAYAFPVLRGLEGALKKVFLEEGISIKDFGDFFRIDGTNVHWAKDCSGLFPNEQMRESLLHLYKFYHRERHTLFHVDVTIETSRTLDYKSALEIAEKGLNLIDQVYRNLN